jgi:ligand-binding SRPBCC domain-containing protein
MKVYTLTRTQFLPITLEDAWNFFSSPANLAEITPPYMKFIIEYISGGGKMYAGQIIRYRLYPIPNVPIRWTTEITHVDAPNYFVDEQRFGPYALWHHQHHFKAVAGGVEMVDEVNYAIPLGVLGRLANTLFVRKQVNAIFEYRYRVLANKFSENQHNIRKSA